MPARAFGIETERVLRFLVAPNQQLAVRFRYRAFDSDPPAGDVNVGTLQRCHLPEAESCKPEPPDRCAEAFRHHLGERLQLCRCQESMLSDDGQPTGLKPKSLSGTSWNVCGRFAQRLAVGGVGNHKRSPMHHVSD
jgi:hypothetical protein